MKDQQRIVFLGTAVAMANADQDTTYMVFDTPGFPFLIDCAGSPAHKLQRLGLDPRDLGGILLTHSHADHIYGLPSLVQDLVLRGRDEPLPIYANPSTRQVAQAQLAAFDMPKEFEEFLQWCEIAETRNNLLLERAEFSLYTASTDHILPSLAVRINSRLNGTSLTYSGDTTPCPNLIELATGTDILVHEASVLEPLAGHSTVQQAAETAAEVGARRLIMIHYHPDLARRPEQVLAEVSKYYGGEVTLARDYDSIYL